MQVKNKSFNSFFNTTLSTYTKGSTSRYLAQGTTLYDVYIRKGKPL